MINATELCKVGIEEGVSNSELLKTLGEIYLPAFLLLWLGSLLLILGIGLSIIKKDYDKFFVIFLIPLLLGVIILIFTFIIPLIPNVLGGLFKGMLG